MYLLLLAGGELGGLRALAVAEAERSAGELRRRADGFEVHSVGQYLEW